MKKHFHKMIFWNAHYVFLLKLLFAMLCIAFAIMLDDVQGVKYALTEGFTSVYYCFFNSVVFSGMFGTYVCAIICVIPYASSYLKERNSGIFRYIAYRTGILQYTLSKFVAGSITSGLCLSMGYGTFIMILSTKTSFVNSQDILSGLHQFPYVSISLSGRELNHIILILYYGFLTGSLWGGVTVFASAYICDPLSLAVTPFICKFLIVQIYRIARIPEIYRLDFWLYMGEVLISPKFTAIVSFLSIGFILTIFFICFKKRVERSVRYE